MTERLTIGFLPLVDACLPILAHEHGFAEEEGHWLEGRHEGLAPEIDGVVYIDGAGAESHPSSRHGSGPGAGEFVRVTISNATTYDVVGHLAGEGSSSRERASEPRQPRGDYR